MTRGSIARRAALAALAALAGPVSVPFTGCGTPAVLRLPRAKILGAVVRFVKDHGHWILVLVGLGEAGQRVSGGAAAGRRGDRVHHHRADGREPARHHPGEVIRIAGTPNG